MNRRRFLAAVAAVIVATPLAPLLPKRKTMPLMVIYSPDFSLIDPFYVGGEWRSYKIDWPIGLVNFDEKTLLRLTSPIAL